MKKTNLIISALVILCMCSCSFFTTSWGTGLKRDLSDTYGKMNSSDLAEMIKDPSVINDKDAGKELLKELGKRDDLSKLSQDEQTDVLNLMVNSSISSDSITSIIDKVSNSDDSTDATQLVEDILNLVDTVDTGAAKSILEDTDNIKNLDPSSAALATVCLVAQVAKEVNGIGSDVLVEKLSTVMSAADNSDAELESTIDTVIAELNLADQVDTMKVALKAAAELVKLDAEIFPGMELSSLISGSSGE